MTASVSLLNIQNISLTFPQTEKAILSDINYQAQSGDFIIVLGSNGSGKSSLLKILNNHYQPTAGKIYFDNQPLDSYPNKTLTTHIKTLTQNCHDSLFISLTVFENYLLVKQRYESSCFALRIKSEKNYFKDYIAKFNANLTAKLDQMVELLSGGEKQALALALIVLYPPRVLLLDEHTSALDPQSAARLMQLTHAIAQEYHITCFLTTHDLAIAEKYGNRILALRNGKIHQKIERIGSTALNQQSLLAACY